MSHEALMKSVSVSEAAENEIVRIAKRDSIAQVKGCILLKVLWVWFV